MASNYLKALQLTKQLEKKAQEATKFRKLAEAEIADAEELIKTAKNMDANVAKAEAKLTEATNALAQKEFKTASEHAQESKNLAEKAVSEHVFIVLDSTKNLVKLAKDMGIKAPNVEEFLAKADSAVAEKRYEVALEQAEKGWEVVDKLHNENVSQAFTKAQTLIVMAKKMGQNVSEVEALLDKAREYTEKSEYENALKFIYDGTQQATKLVEDEISKLMENITFSLDLANRMGADVANVEELKSEVQAALDAGDFDKTLIIINKSQIEIEKIVGKASTKIIRECEELIKDAKKINAEVTKAFLLFNKAKESFKSKNFAEVFDYSNQIKEEVENAQFQCVLKTISLSRPKFITAKNIGANLSEAVKFLDMARGSLKDKKFEEAMEFARKGETTINKLISNYEGAKEELQLITQAISRAAKIGVDTTQITDMMKDAKRSFDAKDYKKAMSLISQCREKIEQAMYDHTMEIIKKSEGVISLGEKTDSEVNNVKEYLDQAMGALKAEDYAKAIELAKKSREEAGGAIKKGITKEIVELTSLVNTLEDGEEKGKCLSMLSSASDVLDVDNYEEAFSHILGCKTYISTYTKTSVEAVESKIKALAEMKGEYSESEEVLEKIKSFLEKEDYPSSIRASKELFDKINHQQQKIVSNLASSIIESIQQAKKKGMDVSELNDKLRRANDAIGKRNYLDAYRIMNESKERTLAFIEEHDKLNEALIDLKLRLEDTQKKGIDITSVERKYEEAEKSLSEGNFENVSNIIEESKNELDGLVITSSIQEKMELGKKCIEIAKSLEIDPSEMELQIKKAVIYMNKGQLENALDSSKIAAEKAEEICNVKISDLLSNAYSMIIEAKKIGLDVLTVEVLYQKAEEALELRHYEKAAKYASQSLSEIEEIRDESQRTANIINLAGNYIQEAENIKADVTEAKKLLEKALSELKSNEYLTSIELGKKCIRIAKRAKELKVTEAISSFQSIIDKSKREGVDVSKAEKLLEEAKDALVDEDYNEALRLAMLSESEVEKVDLQKKMAAEIIAVTAAKLKEAEKKGIQADSVRKLLINAATSLKNHEYVKALEFALESGMVLSETAEEYERAQTTVQAAQARINESSNLGVDVKKANELLETARKAFEEKNFITSIKYAKESIKEAKRSYVGNLSIPIETCEQLISSAGDLGVDVVRANNMLNEAKAALEEESYSQVAVFTENCRRLLERGISRNMFEKLSLARNKMAQAEKRGVDLAETTALMKSGESYLESKEYINAAKFIIKLMDQIEGIEPSQPKAKDVIKEEEIEKVAPKPEMDLEPLISELAGKLLRISKSGIHTKTAEKLLSEAQGVMQSDQEKAQSLIKEAEFALEKELEPLSPIISAEIDLGSITEKEKWYEITLIVTNSGKSVAKDVNFDKKDADFEIEGLEPIKIIKANEKMEIPLKIKALDIGDNKLGLDITFSRIFDGKSIEVKLSKNVQIGEKVPKEPSYKKIKAATTLKCYACNGKIKPGFMVLECSCGNTYHEVCGERIGKCPMCGNVFKKKSSAKKKLALRVS